MKLETFFEKFDQFAVVPDAVTKMRELVLQLAVQGRLVHQDINDEPAEEMLQRITSTAKSRRRGIDESDDLEEPFKIPGNWAWVRLTRVLNKLTDGTHHSPPNKPSGDFMYVTAKNIKTDGVELQDITYVSKGVHEAIFSRCDPSFGDVLYIKDGATTGVATINRLNEPFSMLSSVALLKPSTVILNRYLLWAMRSPFFYEETRSAMKGAAITRVTLSVMAASLLPLPPLAEQKRIVAKVEELMALCDRLEAQQKERERQHTALSHAAIARFDHSPSQANLNFLFHPSYSVPPADLRKAVLSASIQGHLSKHLTGIATWPRVTLNSICLQITDGEHATPERVSEGIPLATAKNIRDGFLDFTKTDWVASDTAERCWRRCKPRQNDILMVCVGATTGRICLVQDPPEMVLVRSVALIRPNEKLVFPAYLELFLRSPEGQSLVWSNVKQSAQPCLYLGKINSFEMPLPTLEEQRHIVGRVNRLMILVNQLDTQLRSSQMEATQLLDAVIHELLHPTADIIDFSGTEFDRASQRAAIGCYAIEYLARNPSFGRTMLMKACYLSETHLGLPLGWQPMRQAAGPWDPWIEDFESLGTRSGWFTVTEKAFYNGHSKIEYATKKGIKTKAAEAIKVLGSQKAEFDRLLGLFADKSTEDAEIITTLFAAWNDFLIDGKSPTDDEIIHEVRENWHQTKERFTPTRLGHWLNWMRDHRLCPKGNPPRTRQQLKLSLN